MQTNPSPWSPGLIKESVFRSQRSSWQRLHRAGRVAQSRARRGCGQGGWAGRRALQLDVTDQASIAAAAERIRKELGRLDVLVNNAAISNTSKLPGMSIGEYAKLTRPSNVSLDEVRAVWETNVFGVLAVTRRCCRSCARRRKPASSTCRAALAR
jgi:NAD(P)-dependent dehydrogenase (short-subunit alcohol dehydrogenase family)